MALHLSAQTDETPRQREEHDNADHGENGGDDEEDDHGFLLTQTAHGRVGRLATQGGDRHSWGVDDDEATTLMLEALFDIRAAVYEIHDVVVEPPEDDDEETEEDA